MTLPTIAPADLPAQAYAHIVGRTVIEMVMTPENWRPIQNRRYGVKPLHGTGLWTATVVQSDAEGAPADTTWVTWCREEEYDNPAAMSLTEITPHASARILRIDSLDDLRAISAAYPSDTGRPDWESMASDWDAVFLTDAGQWATRLSSPDLYGWDIECVLWLRHAFTVGRTVEPAMAHTSSADTTGGVA